MRGRIGSNGGVCGGGAVPPGECGGRRRSQLAPTEGVEVRVSGCSGSGGGGAAMGLGFCGERVRGGVGRPRCEAGLGLRGVVVEDVLEEEVGWWRPRAASGRR